MKKIVIGSAALVMLAGCAGESYDTVPDNYTDLAPEHFAAYCRDYEFAAKRRYSEATYRSRIMPLIERWDALMARVEEGSNAGDGDRMNAIKHVGLADCTSKPASVVSSPEYVGACDDVAAGERDPAIVEIARVARERGLCGSDAIDALDRETRLDLEPVTGVVMDRETGEFGLSTASCDFRLAPKILRRVRDAAAAGTASATDRMILQYVGPDNCVVYSAAQKQEYQEHLASCHLLSGNCAPRLPEDQ